MELTGKYTKALKYYNEKCERGEAFPIVKNIYEDKTTSLRRIVVPFTDGVKSLNVVTDLKRL
jgi:preprotein translocase subunit SecA